MRPPIDFSKIRQFTLNTLVSSVAQATQLSPTVRALRKNVEVIRNVPYQSSGLNSHLLDIYRPKDLKKSHPVLLYIHGGGFVTCSKDTHENIGYVYANLGFVVFNINYRLAPKSPFPAALEDTIHAYAWVIEHAKEYQANFQEMIVSGESAGANLALALTIACCFKRSEDYAKLAWETGVIPKIAQLCCGYFQVSKPDRLQNYQQANALYSLIAKRVSRAYLDKHMHAPLPEHALADPLTIMQTYKPQRELPTYFLAVGTKDLLTADTYLLEQALIRQNANVWAKYYPDEDHIFHFLPWRKAAHAFWQDNIQFLEQCFFEKRQIDWESDLDQVG